MEPPKEAPNTPLDIRLGSVVLCRDGHGGRLTYLVLKPENRQITHLVVHYDLLDHQAVVPITAMTRHGHDKVLLDLDVKDLGALPRYGALDYLGPDHTVLAGAMHHEGEADPLVRMISHTGVVAPETVRPGTWVKEHLYLGIPADEIPIGHHTRVICHDMQLGHLTHILLEPRRATIQALVVRKGHFVHRNLLVSADLVSWITAEEIGLHADRATLHALPDYQPMNLDDQITATIEAQLAVCEETRGQPIAVWTHAGVVRLSGRVPSEAVKDAANDVALAVPGVLQVLNGLLTGPDLARAVAQALAGDARTAGIAVDAAASDGEVTLRGWVHTAGEKEAAREVARTVPGVTTLLDELEVRAEGARRVGVWPEEASAAALASALGAPRRG